jgi:hypothetical protein
VRDIKTDAQGCERTRDWQAMAKGIIRAELARRQLTYADLAERLAAIGVKDDERNVSNKINRGTFSAVFFLNALKRLACRTFI